MTEPRIGHDGAGADDEGMSLLALANVLLRRRRMIMALALLGVVVGLVVGLLSTRVYRSTATFIPQGSESGGNSGLALAASQFGIRLPSSGGGTWGPPVYVELLRSRSLLDPIARESVVVAEEGGRRVPVAELLKVKASTPEERSELTFHALQAISTASEVKPLGAVKLSVTTRWPSVSRALADRLVEGVNKFNLETRKSQAAAERQFVEAQAAEAGSALRVVEDQLQSFLQRNRDVSGSPALAFERDRLQREVSRRQEVYTSLLQSREEAKIREVRELPVITVIESPRVPVVGESRNTVLKALMGGLAAGMLGVLIAFVAHAMAGARRGPRDEAREFFELLDEVTPRFLRRRRKTARSA
jgi:uncharacterized protein involved in exopolysaccharide biosynthesis